MSNLITRDKFTGEILGEYEIDKPLTDWLKENVKNYQDSISPPYSATLNGRPWSHKYHNKDLSSGDLIEITIEPKDPITIATVVVAVISAAYSYYVASNIPQGYENTVQDGESIYNANARANSAKPSGVVRELAGQMTCYPDLICPPRRKYIDHVEYLYLNLAVTRGYMAIDGNNVYIAETPITNYTSDVSFQISEPGDDVTANLGHENWYESSEVSDIKLVTKQTDIVGTWTADFTGATITSYLDGVVTTFPFQVGEDFRIESGANVGYYRVESLSGSSLETATVTSLVFAVGSDISIGVIGQYARGSGDVRNVYFADDGAPTFSTTTGDTVVWSSQNGGVNWFGPYQIIPPNETSRYMEFDVNFPQGLVELDSSNNEQNRTVSIEAQWREVGSSSWTTVSSTSFTDNTFDERGYTIEVDFGSEILPEVRFRRVTKDADEVTISDDVAIKRVRCQLETPTSYPDITSIQMQIKGSSAIASSAENKINIRGATRKLPTLAEIEAAPLAAAFDLSASNTRVSSEWDLASADYSDSTAIGGDLYNPSQASSTRMSLDCSPDGLNLIAYISGLVKFFTMDTAFDFNNLSYTGYYTAGANGFEPCARITNSGETLLTLRKQSDPSPYYYITEHTLTTAYDPDTASPDTEIVLNGAEVTGSPLSFFISDDGGNLWVLMDNGVVLAYDVSTPFDMTTASYSSNSFDTSTDLGSDSPQAIYFGDPDRDDPEVFWVLSEEGNIYTFNMSTSGDITTASYSGTPYGYGGGISSDVKDINVFSDRLVLGSTDSDPEAFVTGWSIPETYDSRASRSIIRFVANALYDQLGSDISEQVDFDELSSLDTILEARGDYLDADFSDETTLWEAVKTMLAPGYCEPTVKEGVFSPIRIAAGSDYEHLYTPDIMINGLKVDATFYDTSEPDGVDAEYFDIDTNTMEMVECRLDGDLGLRPKTMQFIGVSSRTNAWRLGMRERRRMRAKPRNYSFETELDALNSNYGDPIAITSALFGGDSGFVTDVDGSTVTLDFEPDIVAGGSAVFRKPDGKMSGIYGVTLTGTPNVVTLTIPSSLDFTPVTDENYEQTLCHIYNDIPLKRAIVRRITPSGDNMVELLAEEYVSYVYEDDDNEP